MPIGAPSTPHDVLPGRIVSIIREGGEAGPWTRANAALIPALTPGSAQGNVYTWTDATGAPGATYWYTLEDVALDGTLTQHPPVSVTQVAPNAVGLMIFGGAGAGRVGRVGAGRAGSSANATAAIRQFPILGENVVAQCILVADKRARVRESDLP